MSHSLDGAWCAAYAAIDSGEKKKKEEEKQEEEEEH